MSSYVYVLTLPSHPGKVKIGYTNTIARRHSELSGGTLGPEDPKLELAFRFNTEPTGRRVERNSHTLAHATHVHGEWFALTVAEAGDYIMQAAHELRAPFVLEHDRNLVERDVKRRRAAAMIAEVEKNAARLNAPVKVQDLEHATYRKWSALKGEYSSALGKARMAVAMGKAQWMPKLGAWATGLGVFSMPGTFDRPAWVGLFWTAGAAAIAYFIGTLFRDDHAEKARQAAYIKAEAAAPVALKEELTLINAELASAVAERKAAHIRDVTAKHHALTNQITCLTGEMFVYSLALDK